MTGVSSQITLTESGGGVKRPGETVQLTCAVSGVSLSNTGMDWVRQPPGKGLEWTGGVDYDGNLYYNSGLKNRLTISRDTSKGQVFLQVRDLKPEDSAVYYCAGDTSSAHIQRTGFRTGALYYNSGLKNQLTISRDTSKGQVFLQVRDLKPEDSAMYYRARDTKTGFNKPSLTTKPMIPIWAHAWTLLPSHPSSEQPGVSSQITLTESGGGVKRPGDTVQLTCVVSGFSLTSWSMHWVRQPPGKGLEWAGAVWNNGALYYNSALKNRLTISRDTSKGQVFLQVRDLKPEDSAMYYCARDTVRKCCSEDVQKHSFPQIPGMSHSALCFQQLNKLLHATFGGTRIRHNWTLRVVPEVWTLPKSDQVMALRLLIGFLMLFPPCVSSQITLTESGGGVKRPGETVQLTCTVSGVSLSNTDMDWVRQPPGKGLEWAGAVWSNGALYYNSALKNRLTISRDTSKGQVFLQVRDLKPEDSAVYYCASDTITLTESGGEVRRPGGALQLTGGLARRLTISRGTSKNQVFLQVRDLKPEDSTVYYCARVAQIEESTCFRDSPLQHPFPPILLCSTAAGQMERADLPLVLPACKTSGSSPASKVGFVSSLQTTILKDEDTVPIPCQAKAREGGKAGLLIGPSCHRSPAASILVVALVVHASLHRSDLAVETTNVRGNDGKQMVPPEAGVSSQITLTESGGGVKRPGETIQLTCAVSGFSLTSINMRWVRQPPGKGLEWAGVVWYDGDLNYNSALKNRLTISRDTSKGQVFLQVRDLTPEDSGLYYCARDTVRKRCSGDVQKHFCPQIPGMSEVVAVLNWCLAEVMGWVRANKLKLNPDKMEVQLVGGSGLGMGDLGLVVNGVALPLRDRVHSLGMLLDSELSLEAQVTAVATSAFLQLRLIHQLCPFLENDYMAKVTHALLHWLPIGVRAQFKVLVMTYKALNVMGPGYLKERLRPYMPSHPLISATDALLREPSVNDIRRRVLGSLEGRSDQGTEAADMSPDDPCNNSNIDDYDKTTCSPGLISYFGIDWVRQPPGKGLEWTAVVGYNGALYYNSGLKNRLTISRDTSKGQVFLQVRDLKPEDSAMYYCTGHTLSKCSSEDI
ncbi:hypothetical protein EYD10_18427 [Varanus komodoensis]|nr:hypothetical protein EYD10_18427 [Varanus komodoensis]